MVKTNQQTKSVLSRHVRQPSHRTVEVFMLLDLQSNPLLLQIPAQRLSVTIQRSEIPKPRLSRVSMKDKLDDLRGDTCLNLMPICLSQRYTLSPHMVKKRQLMAFDSSCFGCCEEYSVGHAHLWDAGGPSYAVCGTHAFTMLCESPAQKPSR